MKPPKQTIEAGRKAFRDGLNVYQCPFKHSDPRAFWWVHGWKQAQELEQSTSPAGSTAEKAN